MNRLAVQLQNSTPLHSSIEAFLIGQANMRGLGTNLPFSFILPRFDLRKSWKVSTVGVEVFSGWLKIGRVWKKIQLNFVSVFWQLFSVLPCQPLQMEIYTPQHAQLLA